LNFRRVNRQPERGPLAVATGLRTVDFQTRRMRRNLKAKLAVARKH
jgi:hypothetical protein